MHSMEKPVVLIMVFPSKQVGNNEKYYQILGLEEGGKVYNYITYHLKNH